MANFARPIFTPDYNDPEVRMVRGRILNRYPERRARYTDEIARAGLLGSGVAMNNYRNLDVDQEREIEQAEGGVFARQSNQNFRLHEMGLAHELELERQREASKTAMLGQLLGIGGGIAGLGLTGGFKGLFKPRGASAAGAGVGGMDPGVQEYMMELFAKGGW